MLRTFLAFHVQPEGPIPELLHQFRQELDIEAVRWADQGQLHLTLHFLGDTNESQLPSLSQSLSAFTKLVQPIEIIIDGCGIFPSYTAPHVIWLGVSCPDNALDKFYQDAGYIIARNGFKEESRKYNPHITIGRIIGKCNIGKLKSMIEENYKRIFVPITLSRINIYESMLTRQGARYKIVAEFPFIPPHAALW